MKTYLFSSLLVLIIFCPFCLLAQGSSPYSNFRLSNSKLTNTRVNHIDTDLLIRMMEARQQQEAKEEEADRRKAIASMRQTKSYYSSFKVLPKTVADGWHNVIAMNNDDFCEERKVFVSGNKIVKYVKDNWLEMEVIFSGQINEGKTLIKLKSDDDISLLDIYFIEYLSEPTLRTTAPLKPGSVSFWTTWKKASGLKLYFSGVNVGTFTKYFPREKPICGQEGTLTVTFKPGTYSYWVESEVNLGQIEWEGQVTIYEDDCALQGLGKK